MTDSKEAELAPLLRRRDPRAVDGEELADDALVLRIKATGDGREYRVPTSVDDTVSQLKRAVVRVLGAAAEGKHVRLIAAGRLLTPDDAKLSTFKVLTDNSFVHCVLSSAPPRPISSSAAGQPLPSVDPSGAIDDDESSDEDLESGGARRVRRGFDRLRDSGMTRSEVAAVRAYFAPQVRRHLAAAAARASGINNTDNNSDDEDIPSGADPIAGSSGGSHASSRGDPPPDGEAAAVARLDRLLQAEEEWMSAQGDASEFAVNTSTAARARRGEALAAGDGLSNFRLQVLGAMDDNGGDVGGTRDFLFGCVMGFFLGFIMLFWLWEGAVPQRQKLGILTGVMLQLLLNFVRRSWQEEAQA